MPTLREIKWHNFMEDCGNDIKASLLSRNTGKSLKFYPGDLSPWCALKPSLGLLCHRAISPQSRPASFPSKSYDYKKIPDINLHIKLHLLVCFLKLNLKLCLRSVSCLNTNSWYLKLNIPPSLDHGLIPHFFYLGQKPRIHLQHCSLVHGPNIIHEQSYLFYLLLNFKYT